MKRKIQSLLFIIFSLSILQCGSSSTSIDPVYKPIYMSYTELQNSIALKEPQQGENFGKIYTYNNMLFINEIHRGVHIYDNTNPVNPVNLGFLNIPGNKDIAIRDNIMYADSFTNLVTIDITNPINPVIIKTIERVFPYPYAYVYSKTNYYYYNHKTIIDEEKGIVTGWEYSHDEKFDNYSGGFTCMRDEVAHSAYATNTGTAGSMARFTITDNYLYTIEGSKMKLFNIETANNPQLWKSITIDWNIETIFPHKTNLFIGSRTGMHIYDNSDPANPVHASTFEHITSCDPVVVSGDIAYVTLRSGSSCGGGVNRLDVIDVSDIYNPHLLSSQQHNNPHGLAVLDTEIDGAAVKYLYICDGEYGLKSFDILDPLQIMDASFISSQHAYDIILNYDAADPLNGIAIVVGNDGLYQYRIGDFEQLSYIPIIKFNSADTSGDSLSEKK